ncbi:uncharacterized protein At4g04775-like [Lotus japonicus]|uniref:uncharacterized protein At4g04775-like n=1 Tax=Lotus japonicus TaxID=34305 RepID=UPI0025849F19|nr:uncharacterized protein At4g04775-like [Lotus japonicus]
MSQMSRESRSSARSSSSFSVRRRMIRNGKCFCGDRVVFLTSHTGINPNRDFWRCRHFLKPNDCGFFLWDDEAGLEAYERQNLLKLVKISDELADMKRILEDTKRELEETKNKLVDSNKKLEDRKNLTILTCVLLCVLLVWAVAGMILY